MAAEKTVAKAAKAPKGEEARRARVVRGWAFREWTREERQAIRHYLDTGEMIEGFPGSYRELHETVK
ncbi:hypothetical protein ACFVH9_07205 [Streptomyces hirsutus]|uniref:hypothetical protein n=1 Tax=Streptomyces hirsutus TaxID=35620 RepID=UPI00363DE6F6